MGANSTRPLAKTTSSRLKKCSVQASFHEEMIGKE